MDGSGHDEVDMSWRFLLPLAVAAGCSSVHTSRDAPFELHGLRSALWSVGAGADDGYAQALLVLSSARHLDCDALEGRSLGEATARVAADGAGVLFHLVQYGATSDWTGAWTEDGAFVPPGDDSDPTDGRSVLSAAFDAGLVYDLGFDGDDHWVAVDDADDRKVAGAFDVGWWWGDFRAEPCAAWDDALPTTSTYGYGSY